MTTENTQQIISILEKANESIKEARFLLEGNFRLGVGNRIYYACFYAVSALLLS